MPTSVAPHEDGAPARSQLNRSAIVEAGLQMAARPGVHTLSFRRLGRELGYDHSAIYRHLKDKEQLIRLLLDELVARSLEAVSARPTEWRDYLEQFAVAILRNFVKHPSVGSEAVVFTTYGPAERESVENILVAFNAAGLGDTDTVQYFGLYTSFLLARAAGIARSRSARSAAEIDEVPWVDESFRADQDIHPLAAKHHQTIISLVDDELYIDGVRMILDSAEQRIQETH